MKKSLLFSLVTLIVLKSAAQEPTLSAANSTPTLGEVFQDQYAKTTSFDTLNGGANQTWDYSNLSDSNASVGLQVVTPSSTPYSDSFPASNLSIKTINDSAYIYFNSQTAELGELGVVAPNAGSIKYTKPKVYLSYPFSYGSFFTDSVVEESDTYNVALRGKDSLNGEGYGTLEIPGHSYSNVLRIKYIENVTGTKDSVITISGFPFPVTAVITINLRTVSYLYFTPDTHAPLLANEETQATVSATAFGIPVFDTSTLTTDVYYLKTILLPLTFTSFKAQLNGKEVSLQWQTAQEVNTNNFSVQRGLNGKDFSDIAAIKATGNSLGAHYSYADQSFVKTEVPPAVYYRIKETDKNGKAFYSSIANIHGNASSISIYPNPVKSYINFNAKDVSVADAIIIFDAKGRTIQQWQNHSLDKAIDIASFAKGTYFMQIKIKDKTINTKLIKE